MQKTLMISTRKGLFEATKSRGVWSVSDAHFMGDNVTLMLRDPRDGTDYATLNHGHFGIKLHRRDKGKKKWVEIASPELPEDSVVVTSGQRLLSNGISISVREAGR